MQLLQDGVIAVLAAVGLTATVWLLVGILFHPRRRHTLPALVVVPLRGDAPGLEQTVRALVRDRSDHGGFGQILLVDCGLTEEAACAAQLLAQEDGGVEFCQPPRLMAYIGQTKERK